MYRQITTDFLTLYLFEATVLNGMLLGFPDDLPFELSDENRALMLSKSGDVLLVLNCEMSHFKSGRVSFRCEAAKGVK